MNACDCCARYESYSDIPYECRVNESDSGMCRVYESDSGM